MAGIPPSQPPGDECPKSRPLGRPAGENETLPSPPPGGPTGFEVGRRSAQLPSTIGPYLIVRELGAGGMGVVPNAEKRLRAIDEVAARERARRPR
ncbi:MAG: hypothetical protein JKY65_18230 [Planctomycetes bacterium]|nr:hypothetical protein [Planctomycetota bacterium]